MVAGFCLQPAQHFVAVDIGEYEVQHDGVNLETRKPQGITAGGRLTRTSKPAAVSGRAML